MKRWLTWCLAVVLATTCCVASATQATEPNEAGYIWSGMKIGGEGFVTAIAFHPTEKDLFYIRTDVGGAFRWDPSDQSWIPLCDAFSRDESSYASCDGIALDAQNPDVVYMATGNYRWAPGDVLKSTDRGATWKRTNLDKAFGGNSENRGMGECIAVDPVNSDIVYVGTLEDGLFFSNDGAATWNPLSAIDCNKIAARNIVFDPTSAKDGKCQTIYIGVLNQGVFATHDGGATWELMKNSPQRVKRMEVNRDGVLYTASEKGLFRVDGEQFTDISPAPYQGLMFNDISIDPNDPNVMMCLGPNSSKDNSYMSIPFWRTEDGGQTWRNVSKTSMHHTAQPWKHESQYASSFSANSHCLKMNPFNNKEAWYCDFAAPHRCKDVDEQPQQWWEMVYNGIEEVVPRGGITLPSGKYPFIAAIADIDGLPFENVLEFPNRELRVDRAEFYNHPWMMSSAAIAFCEEDPNIMLRVGIDWSANGKMEYSLDGSESWTVIDNIRTYVNKDGAATNPIPYGRCAVSSQINPETGKAVFVIIPCYKVNDSNKMLAEGQKTLPLVSMDYGVTWQEVKGLPEDTNITNDYWNRGQPIAADRVVGNRFYLYANQALYVSEDWGVTFAKAADFPCDPNTVLVRGVPGEAGHVWLSASKEVGLNRSTDGGKTFTKLDNVAKVAGYGFGKNAPDSDYATLYTYANIGGKDGVYRSTDEGVTFQRINDDSRQYGSVGQYIEGDMQTYGVVYMALDGRGYVVGMPQSAREELSKKPVPSVKRAYETTVVYNGQDMKFDDYHIMASYLYVPIRQFMEQVGVLDGHWDNATNSYLCNWEEDAITYQLLKGTTVNGEGIEKPTDTPRLINDKTYVALYDAVKAIGATVTYDNALKQYTVTK